MNKIWTGPVTTGGRSLWYGPDRGSSLVWLAATTTTNGVTTPVPEIHAEGWLGTWLQRNPNWDWTTFTFAQFDKLFKQSVREFSSTIDTVDPDLSTFKRNGGKILIWHGLADQLIPSQGTIQYYKHVQHAMGGAAKTDSFARLFLAPGAAHCDSGTCQVKQDKRASIAKLMPPGSGGRRLRRAC